jgi:asparagine synthase (glutamine-hydrolysing)
MCGLAGVMARRGGAAEALNANVRAMTDSLFHRGPDSSDIWMDANAGIALGHRRLAIIDLSAEGAQPMHSADGRYVIVYNGEIYNFAEMRAELEGAGHTFRGHSDTEVMLAAIAEWGLQPAVERFIGMFAFALWDRQGRKLHLVRDRLGIKPMYYAETGAGFLFGSELRAIRRHPAFHGELDRAAVSLYLQRNCIPAPWTVFANARKLPPASILTVSADAPAPRIEAYWSLRDVAEAGIADPFPGNRKDIADELESLLGDAVRRRMVADVPLGVFLSGGVDSSAVAALMQAGSTQPIKTFSIGFTDAGYDEARDARAVAQHLGTEHHELYLDEADALAVVPRLGRMYDEPFADSSQIPTYLVSEMARREVTVVLSGDGGDEVFAGYNRYMWVGKVRRAFGWMPGPARAAAAAAITAVPPDAWDRLAGLLRQRTPGDKLHKMAGILGANDDAGLYENVVSQWKDPAAAMFGVQPADNLVRRRADWPDLPSSVEQMMYLDAMTYMPDDILTKVDRASMAVSLEARVPILDHRVVAFAWRLPLAAKLNGGVSKQPLRDVLYRHVPRDLIERPKMGFSVPIHDWLRGTLRDWCEDLLAERRLADDGIFDPKPIRALWDEHLSGRRNHQHELWDILMFQAWQDADAA